MRAARCHATLVGGGGTWGCPARWACVGGAAALPAPTACGAAPEAAWPAGAPPSGSVDAHVDAIPPVCVVRERLRIRRATRTTAEVVVTAPLQRRTRRQQRPPARSCSEWHGRMRVAGRLLAAAAAPSVALQQPSAAAWRPNAWRPPHPPPQLACLRQALRARHAPWRPPPACARASPSELRAPRRAAPAPAVGGAAAARHSRPKAEMLADGGRRPAPWQRRAARSLPTSTANLRPKPIPENRYYGETLTKTEDLKTSACCSKSPRAPRVALPPPPRRAAPWGEEMCCLATAAPRPRAPGPRCAVSTRRRLLAPPFCTQSAHERLAASPPRPIATPLPPQPLSRPPRRLLRCCAACPRRSEPSEWGGGKRGGGPDPTGEARAAWRPAAVAPRRAARGGAEARERPRPHARLRA